MNNLHSFVAQIVFITVLFTLFICFFILVVVIAKNKQLRQKGKEEKLVAEHEKSLLRARIQEQEKVMKRISGKISESINQTISYLRVSLNMLSKNSDNNIISDQIARMDNALESLSADIMIVDKTLDNDRIGEEGLINTLSSEIDRINSFRNLCCKFTIDGQLHQLPPEKELLICRIAQEAISNALQHAEAANLHLSLVYQNDRLVLKVADDGKGFEKTEIRPGIGFQEMKDRAGLLSGAIDIRSFPAKGTTVTLTVNNLN